MSLSRSVLPRHGRRALVASGLTAALVLVPAGMASAAPEDPAAPVTELAEDLLGGSGGTADLPGGELPGGDLPGGELPGGDCPAVTCPAVTRAPVTRARAARARSTPRRNWLRCSRSWVSRRSASPGSRTSSKASPTSWPRCRRRRRTC